MDHVDRSRQHHLLQFYPAMIAVSCLFALARFLSRFYITKAFRMDDYFAFVAWLMLTCQTIMDLVGAVDGIGLHLEDVDPKKIPEIINITFTAASCSCLVLLVIRLAILTMFLRLWDTKLFKRIIAVFAAIMIIEHFVIFFLIIFQCNPVIQYWHRTPKSTCPVYSHEQKLYVAFCVFSVVFDIILFFIPIVLVALRILSFKKAFRILVVFSLGIFGIVIDIIRLITVKNNQLSSDVTWILASISTWGMLEEHVGLWVACFPAIFPLLRKIRDAVIGKDVSTMRYFFGTELRRAAPMKPVHPLNSASSSNQSEHNADGHETGLALDSKHVTQTKAMETAV